MTEHQAKLFNSAIYSDLCQSRYKLHRPRLHFLQRNVSLNYEMALFSVQMKQFLYGKPFIKGNSTELYKKTDLYHRSSVLVTYATDASLSATSLQDSSFHGSSHGHCNPFFYCQIRSHFNLEIIVLKKRNWSVRTMRKGGRWNLDLVFF